MRLRLGDAMDKPDGSYVFEAIERIKRAVSEAKRSWRSEADRAKLLASATYDAADTLERLSQDDDLWEKLAAQRKLPIAQFSLPLIPELLTALGYDQDDAERLVGEGNRMLKRLTTGPAEDRAAAQHLFADARKTIAELAQATRRLAEEADDGIANLERRQGHIRRLLGLLDQVLNILMNIAVGVAVAVMPITDPPSWAAPAMELAADLRDGLGDATLWLLTFAAAEQGARIATAFAHPTAASLTTLRSWAEPSWRPLASTADPQLVKELERLLPNLLQPNDTQRPKAIDKADQLHEDLPGVDEPLAPSASPRNSTPDWDPQDLTDPRTQEQYRRFLGLPPRRRSAQSPKPDGRSMFGPRPADPPAGPSRSPRDDTPGGRGIRRS
jgi:hypothetical protein